MAQTSRSNPAIGGAVPTQWRAAALVPHGDGMFEVVAVLGMRWRPGKVLSGRSLRGLRPPVPSTGQALNGVRDGHGQRFR